MHPTLVAFLLLALSFSVLLAEPVTKSQSDGLKESTGRTDLKAYQRNNQQTQQGPSGPLNTTSGGTPASSPQGQTPPGMQAAPEGSDKTVADSPNK